MSSSVLVESTGRVMTVTINRPVALNSIDNAVADGLLAAIEELDADDGLSVAVVTGAGGVFCTGMDLKAFARDGAPRRLLDVLGRGSRKPLVAAIEGYALGGGLELALTCDLIVAADDARLGLPEVRVGMLAAGGGVARLGRRLPYSLAMELALTGERLSAEQAERHGLVNRVVPAGEALKAAAELAERVARNAPLAVSASKQLMRDGVQMPEKEFWEHQRAFTRVVMRSNDAREGARAFAEKRAPRWSGT